MPTLTLIFQGKELPFTLAKIDRDRLYGYVDRVATDEQGRPCTTALLAGDGRTLAGKGDTALAYLSPDGDWRERSELHAVDAADGSLVIPVKPTFAFPVNLDAREPGSPCTRASVDHYLA